MIHRTPRSRIIPALVWMLVFAIVLAGCRTGPEEREGLVKIRLVEVTHSLFYAPQYVAMSKGFFKEEGLEIELSNGNGGDKTMTALVSGQADVALVGAEAAVYVTARSSQNAVQAFAQLTQTDGSFLVSREPIDNFDWSMLRGRTLLGQRRGGMPQMVSEYVQRRNNLVPHKDVKIIQNVDYANLGNAFAAGTGEFAQLFEPVASKLEQEGKGYVVASFGTQSGRLPYTCYLAQKRFLEQNPEWIKKFTRAIRKGQLWVAEHSPEEIAQVMKEHFPDTSDDILLKVIRRYKEQDSYAADPIIDREEYDRLLDIMRTAGELPREIPYEQLVNTRFAEEAKREITQAP